jgi:CHAT domain-containing protein/Tfp pilus assembly protein PilF
MRRVVRAGWLLLALPLLGAAPPGKDSLAEKRRRLARAAEGLHTRGWQHYQRGQLADAVALTRRALALWQKRYPAARYPQGHPHLAAALNNLGAYRNAQGKPAEAEKFYRAALAMNRRLHPEKQGHLNVALNLANLGAVLTDQGKYTAAKPVLVEALAVFRRLYPVNRYPKGHPDVAQSLNDLAFLFSAQGEYARAESLFREALAMYRRLYPHKQGHPQVALGLNNLGAVLYQQAEYPRSEAVYQEALAMRRKLYPAKRYPKGHLNLVFSLNNLGALYGEQGEYAKAEPFYREALAMLRRLFPAGHLYVAVTLNNLGQVLQLQSEPGKAEKLLRAALELKRKFYSVESYPKGHPDLAIALNQMSGLFTEQGKHAQAEAFAKEALAMCRRLFPEETFPLGHPLLAASLNTRAVLLDYQGKHAASERLHREALKMRRNLYPEKVYPLGHPLLVNSLNNLGGLLHVQEKYTQAAPFFRQSLAMSQKLLLRYADLAAEAQALNYAATLVLMRDYFLSNARHLPASPTTYDRLWDGRAALTRVMERRHREALASRDRTTRALATQLRHARQRLAHLLFAPAGASREHAAEVAQLTATKEKLEKDLATRLELASVSGSRLPSNPTHLRKRLPAGTAFVDFLRYTDFHVDPRNKKRLGSRAHYAAFVLRRDRPALLVDLKEAAPIEKAWNAWHKVITARRPDEAAERKAARALGKLVWQPLRKHLPANLDTVYLCPDGVLTQVPFAALPGRKPGTVLLEECAVAVVPHGPFLLEHLREGKAKPGGSAPPLPVALAVGGIDFEKAGTATGEGLRAPLGLGRRLRWPALPGTARERRLVADLARKALPGKLLVRSGRSASTAQLLADLPRVRYAHLATHGFFADAAFRSAFQLDPKLFERRTWRRESAGARSPLVLSGLVLAGANRSGKESAPDRGVLTAEALVGLRLEGLELAVLSACDSGLGEVAGGEGVFGLQRALHLAGCKNVVASLWKVDDDATCALMGLFYRHLWLDRMHPMQALRRAQLSLYRNPAAIPKLAKRRGVDFTVKELPEVKEGPKPGKGKRAPTALWAAFTFSGVQPTK